MHWSRRSSCYSIATIAVGVYTWFTVTKPVTEWWRWDGLGGILLKTVLRYCRHSYCFCFEKSGDHMLSSHYCCQLLYKLQTESLWAALKFFKQTTSVCRQNGRSFHLWPKKLSCWNLHIYGWSGHSRKYFSAELPNLVLSASVSHLLLFSDWIAIRQRPFRKVCHCPNSLWSHKRELIKLVWFTLILNIVNPNFITVPLLKASFAYGTNHEINAESFCCMTMVTPLL